MPQTGAVTILGIDQKSGVKNGKPWTLHKVKASDGNTYDTFEAPLAQAAGQAGSNPVILEYEERLNGQYTNYDLKGVSLANGSAPVAPVAAAPVAQAPAQNGVASTYQQDKDDKITRLSAARTAFEYAGATGLNPGDALALALKIEDYANGQFDLPAPQPVAAAQGADGLPWDD